MARLFVGQKEADFFADISKELIKDVAGQKIFYYTVREDLSDIHDVYEESLHKIFNPPVELECLVEWQPSEVKTTQFGHEQLKTITAYLHNRDLIDRNLDIKQGDYISYGEYFFEIPILIFEEKLHLPSLLVLAKDHGKTNATKQNFTINSTNAWILQALEGWSIFYGIPFFFSLFEKNNLGNFFLPFFHPASNYNSPHP